MSIPKEPRQLMINIMYLVLTALLALNVSAEVFNAFKIVDKGLIKSNDALDVAMAGLPGAIRDGAKTRPSYAPYAEKIEPIREKSAAMTTYLESIVEAMIWDRDKNGKARGGYLLDENGQPTDDLKLAADYDITTRTLIDTENPSAGIGNEVKEKLIQFKDELLLLADEEDRSKLSSEFSIQIDDQTWQRKGKASWAHMNFDHMPLQAVIPIFTKYINDVKATEATALNYLAEKVGVGGTTKIIDDFKVASSPNSSYIIKGEEFKTKIYLSAAAGNNSSTGISYSVNGQALRVNAAGEAIFQETASTNGERKYVAQAKVTDPVTGEVDTYTQEFTYEIGERSLAVSASKMNVLYIGVDNPIELSAAGVPSNQLNVQLEGGGGEIKKIANGQYNIRVTKPTKRNEFVYVSVDADGLKDRKPFRVKRIPDPIPKLSNHRSGRMKAGEFKLQTGIYPDLEQFEFDAECKITEYRIVHVLRSGDPIINKNIGGRFTEKSKKIIEGATPSDKFFFENIRCTCPGDDGTRDLGSMLFNIY